MAVAIRSVAYYSTTVLDRPGEGYQVLQHLAADGINLVAFTAVPLGHERTQLTLFPDEPSRMEDAARRAGMTLAGPRFAVLVQGDDGVGVLAGLHQRLYRAGINVYAASCVADGKGAFGYVLYVSEGQHEAAVHALMA